LARRPRAGGALFPGDALQVVLDRRHVTFMYSYPNYIPMKPSDVRSTRARLEGYAFQDVFGFTWRRNIIGGAREVSGHVTGLEQGRSRNRLGIGMRSRRGSRCLTGYGTRRASQALALVLACEGIARTSVPPHEGSLCQSCPLGLSGTGPAPAVGPLYHDL
jgi:hypothetical protein